MKKTLAFISIFAGEKDGRKYIHGVFNDADGISYTAFGFPGLKEALGGCKLVLKTDKRGIPYGNTPFPLIVEFTPYGDGLAQVVSVSAAPQDTDTLGLLGDIGVSAQASATTQQTAQVPPPAVG